MKRLFRPWVHIVLILTLAAGLLPTGTASAAPLITITNLYVEDTTGNAPPANDSQVSAVTKNKLDVAVTLQGLTAAQMENLQVEIYNTVTKQSVTEKKIPQPVGTSNINYLLKDVPLTEGLNMITVILDTTRYAPGWIYFSAVTDISDLRINSEPFSGNRMYPSNPNLDSLVVLTGKAPNASRVSAYLNGSSSEIPVLVDQSGGFNVTGDVYSNSSSVDLQLRPGDNLVSLVASNPSRSYRVDRTLVYDNGDPFAFGMTVDEPAAPVDDRTLILNPVVVDSQVILKGKIKVDLNALNLLEYDTVEVLGKTFTLDVNNTNDSTATNNLAIDTTWTPVDGAGNPNGRYVVFNFEDDTAFNLNLAGTGRDRTIEFEFSNGTTSVVGSTFNVRYHNPSQPYVDYAEYRIGNGSYIRMSPEPTFTQINEHPVTFRVAVNSNTTSVEMRRGSTVLAADASISGGYAEFTFSSGPGALPIGDYSVTFVPFNGGTAYASNGLTYNVSVSNAPYVIFQNLYEGQTLTASDVPKTVNLRYVNIPSLSYIDVELNNVTLPALTPGAAGSNSFSFNITEPSAAASENRLKEGTNTITVNIYADAAKTVKVTETTLNIFVSTIALPEFSVVEPVEAAGRDDYKSTNVANTYVTNESTVQFTGKVLNTSNLQIEKIGGPGAGISTMAVTSNVTFTTATFTLAETGNTTFVFSITNASGIQVFRTVTIRRDLLPYMIQSPIVAVNADGVEQANINANFVEFIIEAEGSDSILFDGVPAIETSDDLYSYEVRDLKNGKNTIEFTVVRGGEELEAEVVVNNVNTPFEGAMFKAPIAKKIDAFDKQLSLQFPSNPQLRRNDTSATNPFITSERQILFGIANDLDGRVDKLRYPIPDPAAISRLGSIERERFSAVSPLFWIDAGSIQENTTDLEDALRGSGKQPYDTTRFYARFAEDQVVPTVAGTLTLQYNPVIRNDGWRYVTVFHYDAQEDAYGNLVWGWHNIGGEVDPDKNTISVPFQRFGYYQVMYMDQSFNDVIAHEWAQDDLDILYAKGVMKNKESSWFRPFDAMTRGEFATLLVKTFDIPLDYGGDLTFTDVPRVDLLNFQIYNYKYIETAARAGIVRGMENNRFDPNGSITREDAAVMIARAANLKLDNDPDKVLKALQKEFTDANDIKSYSRAAVAAVVDEEFILGMENVLLQGQSKPTFRFEPKTTFTRDQAAAVIIRVMKSNGKIPD